MDRLRSFASLRMTTPARSQALQRAYPVADFHDGNVATGDTKRCAKEACCQL